MVTADTISLAAKAPREAAPRSRVILFGSHARGDAGPDSDLGLLAVEPSVTNRRQEMVRLADARRRHRIYADVLVISESDFRDWSAQPGNVFYEEGRTGKVLSR